MDEFTKKKVRRAIKQNPDLPVKCIISAVRALQQGGFKPYVRSTPISQSEVDGL